jgi:GH24 family phage-related lysozyme (muramidase)
MRRIVTVDQVNSVLRRRAEEAAKIVRSIVTHHRLTQAQFDAAVSFAYNSRTHDAHKVLFPANTGDFATVAARMMLYVYVYPRDKTGKKIGLAKRFLGLVNRRLRESRPFLQNY